MQNPGKSSIRSKLRWLAMLAASSALILASAGFITNDMLTLRRVTTEQLGTVGDVFAANLIAPLAFRQPEPAEELLASLRYQPMIEFACVYDQNHQPFATYSREGSDPSIPPLDEAEQRRLYLSEDGRIHVSTEIRDADGLVGTFFIRAGTEHLRAQLAEHIWVAVIVLALALGASSVISATVQKKISTPILELAETAEQISHQRDYSIRVQSSSTDELGSLYEAFNRMLDEIQAGARHVRAAHDELEDRVLQRTQELTDANQQLNHEVAERKRAEDELRAIQSQHIEAARRAGMAEIATSVLHNVGNVLNSVNISANLVTDWIRKLGISDFVRATGFLQEHSGDLDTYLTTDERGRHLPAFLIELSREMAREEEVIATEITSMLKSIEHIKEIVSLQQSFAGSSGLVEVTSLAELLDHAIRINQASLLRHDVEVVRDFEELPPIPIDRQKLLQICINLISNAKYAVIQRWKKGGRILVRLYCPDADRVCVEVTDNGSGISPDNLTKIFAHGFTTKKDGHGFGLHSSALYANQMGGRLKASSPGPGAGAAFILELPRVRNKEDASWSVDDDRETTPGVLMHETGTHRR